MRGISIGLRTTLRHPTAERDPGVDPAGVWSELVAGVVEFEFAVWLTRPSRSIAIEATGLYAIHPRGE